MKDLLNRYPALKALLEKYPYHALGLGLGALLLSCACCIPLGIIGNNRAKEKATSAREQAEAKKKEDARQALLAKEWIKMDLPMLPSSQIHNEFIENEPAAKKRYEGKDLHVSVTVFQVKANHLVCMVQDNRPGSGLGLCHCYFDDAKEISRIEKDANITVQGVCKWSGGLKFEKCRVLPRTPQEAKQYADEVLEARKLLEKEK